jgi:hypothetical protein
MQETALYPRRDGKDGSDGISAPIVCRRIGASPRLRAVIFFTIFKNTVIAVIAVTTPGFAGVSA